MAQNLSGARPVADSSAVHDADTAPVDFIARVGSASRFVALLAAWLATGGSLFFSEVLHWVPCVLCWYQRILMYPLSIVLAVGLLRRDRGIHAYVLPFSLIGAGVSLYHYLLQKTDWLPPPACSISVPCNVDYINLFGFITVPFLALTAFLIISLSITASALLAADETGEAIAAQSWAARFGMDRAMVFVTIAFVILSFIAATWLI